MLVRHSHPTKTRFMADFGAIFEKPVRIYLWVTLYGNIGQLRDKTSTCMYNKQITIQCNVVRCKRGVWSDAVR